TQASFIDDDIVLSGIFNCDTLIIDTISLNGKGDFDGFITRIDSTGKVKWAKQIGSAAFDQIGYIYIDNNKDIYFGGKFEDSLTIDTISSTNTGVDLFLAKLNGNGNIYWLKQGHSTGENDFINDLTSFRDSEIVVTGSFSGSITFGNQNMSTVHNQDMFISRFNKDGLCLGADHFGEAKGFFVVKDNSDELVCIGKFNDTVTLNGIALNSVGAVADLFIAKHSALTEIHETTERRNNSLLIYANPNQGICNIQVPEEFRGEKSLTLKVYGQNGALLKIISIDPGNSDVDLTIENEAKGIYTAILSNGKKQFTGKIIFE
ncbi:MAG TPA: T9SS type A sorting domain-containing protein, partial [Bacteroidia bacterium]|nr:T9SS type A sorting domain-containing protein [Bacteroidia bacterium]